MTGFRFENLLWLLLLIPLVALGAAAIRRRRSAAILYSDVSLLLSLPPTITARINRLVPWLRILGLALLIVALARPQRGVEEMRVRTEGIAIQMCLDRSGSMAEEDFTLDGSRVDRLTAVKSVFRDFVQGKGKLEGRPDDLVGVIAFAGYPDSKCPLTLDHGAVLQVLETIQIAELGRGLEGRQLNRRMPRELQQRLIEALNEEKSTAIGDALVLAVDRIKDIDANSRVIVLLSDGRNNAGQATPQEAAEAAKAFGIKVYTIGVGSTEGATRDLDIFGLPRWRPTMSDLDEETLKAVADTTGGRYFHAADTEALETVYVEIDKLEKTVTEGWPYTQHHELCFWPMLAGVGLIVTQIVLVCTRFRSLP